MSWIQLKTTIETWPLRTPFHITGYTIDRAEVVVVELEAEGICGFGEAVGVYYHGDTAKKIRAQIEAVRDKIELGVDRQSLKKILPPGGARNAVDCALWDIECKLSGRAAWQIAEFNSPPKPILTTITCSADAPEVMAEEAARFEHARAIKLKLTGEAIDVARVEHVRNARPDVWLSVDANQGYKRASLLAALPAFVALNVSLIEQPFRIGEEHLLDDLQSPIPLAADESAQSEQDLAALVGRVQAVNIKLDKCGGLTSALDMAARARALGLNPMVGNMLGTSLAMAPAFLVGQLCMTADLDGPIFLGADRKPSVFYKDGLLHCPPDVWGCPNPQNRSAD